MVILGVDPGLEGALAFLDGDEIVTYDMPTAGEGTKRKVDGANLAIIIRKHNPDSALIELVTAMQGWGIGSAFRFGESAGTIAGAIAACGVPITRVVPRVWKKTFGLGPDKEETRQRAIQMFPRSAEQFARKKDHQRADAALMALYHRAQRQSL